MGLVLELFKFLTRGKVKKMLKKYEDDPEFQAIVKSYKKESKKYDKDLEAYRKRNPKKKLPWEE